MLDASALWAVLNQESGTQNLSAESLAQAIISTVNLAEAHSKLVREGVDPDEAWEDVMSPIHEYVPFTMEQAQIQVAHACQNAAHMRHSQLTITL